MGKKSKPDPKEDYYTSSTPQELEDALNLVAEYAGVNAEFVVKPHDEICSSVSMNGARPNIVHTAWCVGNTRRLNEKTSFVKMLYSILYSHPEAKGLSDNNPAITPNERLCNCLCHNSGPEGDILEFIPCCDLCGTKYNQR
jgi:hypothetical protein